MTRPRTSHAAYIKVGLALGSALPFIVLVVYVAAHAVNVPWGEGWAYAQTVVIPAYDGTITFSHLYAQYMDHRIVTTKLLMVALTYLTRWDTRWHSVVAIIQATVIFLSVVAVFARDDRAGAWVMAVPASMLIFAVNVSTVWLRPYNDVLFPFVFLLLAIWVMTSGPPRWPRLIGAAACAIGATFSTLIGTLTWLAMLPGLWATGYRKARYYVVWGMLYALCMTLYWSGFSFSKLTIFGTPAFDVVLFALTLLGTAFSRSVPIAIAVAIVGLAVAAFDLFLLRHAKHFARRVAGWVTLGVYGLLSVATTASGRAYLGTGFAAMQPHYTMISTCTWLGIIALSLITLQELRGGQYGGSRRVGLVINMALLALLLPLYLQVNIAAARHFVVFVADTPGPTPADESCLRRAVITKKRDCFHNRFLFGSQYAPINEQLARRRLATFGRMEHIAAVMPGAYRPSDRIIVDARLAAQHVPVMDGTGAPISEATILRSMADDQRDLFSLDASPGSLVASADGLPSDIDRFLRGASRVWYLATADDAGTRRTIEGVLNRDFVPADLQLDQAGADELLYPVAEIFQRKP